MGTVLDRNKQNREENRKGKDGLKKKSLSGNSGRHTWLPSSISACWVFSRFRKPPDMDDRILNVAYVIILMLRIHTGGGHTDSQSAQHLWLGKNSFTLSCACAAKGIGTRVMEVSIRPSTQWSHPGICNDSKPKCINQEVEVYTIRRTCVQRLSYHMPEK